MPDAFSSISGDNQIKGLNLPSPNNWEDIFNTITDTITIHDTDFNIIHANKAARAMLSLPALINDRAVKCFNYYHGTLCPPQGYPSCDCVQTGIPAVFELFESHLNKFIEIRAMPLYDSRGKISGVIHVVRDITDRKQSEIVLKNSREKLRNLTAHMNSMREEERKHIAREIHDELAQALTTLKMDLFWLQKRLNNNQAALIDKTNSMSNLIDRTIDAVRRISSELRPGLLDDLGLQAVMEWQAKEFENRTGISCEVIFYSDISNLDQERATAIFRIFQETLTNVVRHAEATRVRVRVSETKDILRMEVVDNGIGIKKEQISNSGSFGLIGMQERAYLLGGKIDIYGVQGKQTAVTLNIPLGNDNRR